MSHELIFGTSPLQYLLFGTPLFSALGLLLRTRNW